MRRIEDADGAAALASVLEAAGLGGGASGGRVLGDGASGDGASGSGAPGGDRASLAAAVVGGAVGRDALATAVRWTLQRLADEAPGHAVEVRVPPFGAVQAVEGPRHTRGTPPNVVETDAATWLALATGRETWAEALAAGRISASGARADLAAFLPLA